MATWNAGCGVPADRKNDDDRVNALREDMLNRGRDLAMIDPGDQTAIDEAYYHFRAAVDRLILEIEGTTP